MLAVADNDAKAAKSLNRFISAPVALCGSPKGLVAGASVARAFLGSEFNVVRLC